MLKLTVLLRPDDGQPIILEVSVEWDAPVVVQYEDKYYVRENWMYGTWTYDEASFEDLSDYKRE